MTKQIAITVDIEAWDANGEPIGPFPTSQEAEAAKQTILDWYASTWPDDANLNGITVEIIEVDQKEIAFGFEALDLN